ncbi:winged helix DNA-binding protein [Ancylobacter pratisalsi]|uniref:Winged helix DNA-binding protein n=1 Tax=Ancylobacter pratisalsi TaxID=1745854 RepID=A0A6P1YUJ7_9HYPH|nr:winged helix DNA-binding protein [Ancylobacter pratisalsi]QIB35284.1 winged helix DNA-binding protein [Ancylobacter pratisalsi]
MTDLGRRLSVSKQAAAKVIGLLGKHGYVARLDDATDSRRKLLTITDLGYEVMSEGEAIFDELRTAWAMKIGGLELDRPDRRCCHRPERARPYRARRRLVEKLQHWYTLNRCDELQRTGSVAASSG